MTTAAERLIRKYVGSSDWDQPAPPKNEDQIVQTVKAR